MPRAHGVQTQGSEVGRAGPPGGPDTASNRAGSASLKPGPRGDVNCYRGNRVTSCSSRPHTDRWVVPSARRA